MKKILFFAAMFIVALCSTTLMSCGGDDVDDPDEKNYSYIIDIELGKDVMNLYENVMITIETPDAPPVTLPLTENTYKTRGLTSKLGTISVTLSGTLRSDVDDEKDYNIGISEYITLGSETDSNTHLATIMGVYLKEKHQQLSSVPGMKYSHNFVRK